MAVVGEQVDWALAREPPGCDARSQQAGEERHEDQLLSGCQPVLQAAFSAQKLCSTLLACQAAQMRTSTACSRSWMVACHAIGCLSIPL